MQNELKAKLAQRRKDGLTYDLTSEESDVIEDDDGGEDDDDLSRFRIDPSANIRRDRPTSAKRRTQHSPSFEEETTRFGSRSDRFSKKGGGDSMPLLSPTSPKISPKDRYASDRFSPKERSYTEKLSPKGDTMKTMRPGDGDAYMKGRKSPYGEGLASLPKAHGASPRTKSGKSSPLTNEEVIFGKKTPEQKRQSPVETGKWQPPQYRKSSPVQEEGRDTSPGAKGRRTPQDALLAPIDEKPSPRQRKHSGSDKQRYKESPRNLNLTDSPRADQPKPRPRPKTDIFGKTQKVDVDIDDELEEINRSPGRFSKSPPIGRKTPTGYKQGRQTPTEGSGRPNSRQGRQTPTGRSSPSGRKTPTGKQEDKQRFSGRRTPVEEREKFAQNRKPSLMDFLAGDASPEKPERKTKDDKFEKLLSKKKKDSRGILDDDNDDVANSDDLLLPKAKPSQNQPDLNNQSIEEDIPDESSVCEELDREPVPEETQRDEEKKKRLSGKQTLENQGLDNAIQSVASEQSKPPTVKHIDPSKDKKDQTVKLHKPKPRHSLPGTPASTASETSEHMFEDTKSIRQAIYDEWKKERLKEAKKKLAEQKKKEEEEEKKKKQEKEEKIIENKASYNAWKEKKKPELQQKAHEKKKVEDKQKREEEEKEKKKKDALKDFLKWKESKDAEIEKKKKQEAREKKRIEEEKEIEKRKKEKLNETALRGWTKKKETVIHQNETMKKTIIKENKQKEKEHRKQQEEEALERYHDWLQKKEKQQKKERRMRYGSQEDIDFRPPWSPPNNTIPYKR